MRIFVIVIGAIAVLLGAACAIGGSAGAAFVGPDGRIQSGDERFDSVTYALVSDVADITDEDDDVDWIDRFDVEIRIEAEPRAGRPDVFIGVGRAADVDRYFANVEHDVVRDADFDDGIDLDKELVPGTREPEPPGEQDFWEESVSGAGRQELNWDVRSGSWRFVIMNTDASEGVDVDASLGVKLPFIFGAAIGVAVAGLILLIIGVVIIVLAARAGPRPAAPAPAAQPPAEPPPTPEEPT